MYVYVCVCIYIYTFFFLATEGRHANAKAQEAINHLASFLPSREEISRPGIELPTSSLRFGYLSTIIQQFRVVSRRRTWVDYNILRQFQTRK